MTRKPIQIDPDKLRVAVRRLTNETVFYMLDHAIGLLPPAQLQKLAEQYFDLKQLRPDPEPTGRPGVLTSVQRFEKVSLAGEYYESFFVNSKNYMETSGGTRAWIAEYRRLLDRCVVEAKREAMDILFGLLLWRDAKTQRNRRLPQHSKSCGLKMQRPFGISCSAKHPELKSEAEELATQTPG